MTSFPEAYHKLSQKPEYPQMEGLIDRIGWWWLYPETRESMRRDYGPYPVFFPKWQPGAKKRRYLDALKQKAQAKRHLQQVEREIKTLGERRWLQRNSITFQERRNDRKVR